MTQGHGWYISGWLCLPSDGCGQRHGWYISGWICLPSAGCGPALRITQSGIWLGPSNSAYPCLVFGVNAVWRLFSGPPTSCCIAPQVIRILSPCTIGRRRVTWHFLIQEGPGPIHHLSTFFLQHEEIFCLYKHARFLPSVSLFGLRRYTLFVLQMC